jgi:hypothetical protein
VITLYHGSSIAVQKPDIVFSRPNTDFGKGFYTTPFKEQAKKWAERFIRHNGTGVVSVYGLEASALEDLRILEFETYSEEWLEAIVRCRRGETDLLEYDIVLGSVANDKVFDTIEEYTQGYRTKAEALGRLRYEKPNWQYCFKNQAVIDGYLRFISAEEVG